MGSCAASCAASCVASYAAGLELAEQNSWLNSWLPSSSLRLRRSQRGWRGSVFLRALLFVSVSRQEPSLLRAAGETTAVGLTAFPSLPVLLADLQPHVPKQSNFVQSFQYLRASTFSGSCLFFALLIETDR